MGRIRPLLRKLRGERRLTNGIRVHLAFMHVQTRLPTRATRLHVASPCSVRCSGQSPATSIRRPLIRAQRGRSTRSRAPRNPPGPSGRLAFFTFRRIHPAVAQIDRSFLSGQSLRSAYMQGDRRARAQRHEQVVMGRTAHVGPTRRGSSTTETMPPAYGHVSAIGAARACHPPRPLLGGALRSLAASLDVLARPRCDQPRAAYTESSASLSRWSALSWRHKALGVFGSHEDVRRLVDVHDRIQRRVQHQRLVAQRCGSPSICASSRSAKNCA